MTLTPATLRWDKKCGASGIPEGAKCTKGTTGLSPSTPAPSNSPGQKKSPNVLGMIGTGWQVGSSLVNAANYLDYYHKSGGAPSFGIAAAGHLASGALAGLGFAEHAKGNGLAGGLYSLGSHGVSVGSVYAANAYAKHAQREREKQNRAGYKGSDPFKDLGVDQSATLEQLRKAYLKRAASAHPDRGGSAEEMARVNAAYQEAKLRLGNVATRSSRSRKTSQAATGPRSLSGTRDSIWAKGFEV